MTQTYLQPDLGVPCTCDGCGETTMSDELEMVTDVEERVNPGYLCPAGQCPHCGALAYYAEGSIPEYTAQLELKKLREALSNVITSSDANDHGSLMNAIFEAKELVGFKPDG
ncbi:MULTISPECIES: hypothetical protein [Agrobacterium]|uniref:hypothetical protein n=1 Tax=Agrobacterium TaxID=357 RepID=UPI002301C1B9|nr:MULTISPECIES: hypothetical protein [Agrobacterium]MDA5627815.1 hypothetical protein [Agrobacterium sp. ST15.16.055]MDA6978439.1 hypothetical protein [Agrobacterium salinitolerans]